MWLRLVSAGWRGVPTRGGGVVEMGGETQQRFADIFAVAIAISVLLLIVEKVVFIPLIWLLVC